MSELPKETDQEKTTTWVDILRLAVKVGLLFLLFNILFALFSPLEWLGSLSLYNSLLPGRERLPYGENAAESYNLSLNNVPAMMASHIISQEKAADEFRVLIIGDSGTWGWLVDNEDTLAGRINAGDYRTADGRRLVFYNLGYPIMSATKDLLFLEAAMAYEPDLVVWPVTLQSLPGDKQLLAPILQNNPRRVRALIEAYGLGLDPNDNSFVEPNFIERTIVGQRRALADLLRLQLYGFSWAATGVDQAIPEEIVLRQSDFDDDMSWFDFAEPVPLGEDELALEVLGAGVAMAGDVPVLIVNEPIFISDGRNSDLRYNAWYPRWAYDEYRQVLMTAATDNGWHYLDLWDSISPDEFTDSPVHLTPAGAARMADLIATAILEITDND